MDSEPTPTAVVFSDHVIREAGTGKLSLIGCFNRFNASAFPFTTPRFFVTCMLTNIRRVPEAMDITVRVEQPKSGFVFSNVAAHVTFRPEAPPLTPQTEMEWALPVEPFVLQEPGTLSVVILVDNERITSKCLVCEPITAVQPPPKG